MNWITFAILAAIGFGFYDYFVRLSSESLSPTIALMILAASAFCVAAFATFILMITGHALSFPRGSIHLPILAGLFTGVADILYLLMFAKNPSLSIGAPFVVGGTVLVATLLGIVILKEPLNVVKVAGIVLTLVGLIILTRS